MNRIAVIYSILCLLFISCSSRSKEKQQAAWASWKGLSVSEIEKHYYFKQFRVKKVKHEDAETWLYLDQTRFPTDAYCESLGGCVGIPTYNCQNAFSVKNDIILGFEQKGTCPGPKVIEATKKK